jgi:hypothetical protein
MEGMRSSVTEVSFSPARRARFFYVQAQTSNGTASDGLGHAQVVAADGRSGSSSGYNVASLTANGGEVTTTPVTLSASVTDPKTGMTSWGYSAKMLDVQLTRNGADIADPKPEVPVMVGECNAMSVAISPLPADLPPLTYKWTIPGDKIKDFKTTGQIPNNNTNPPTPGTTFTGHKVELPSADLQTQSPYFYWYNGTFAGDSKDVSVDVTIAGKTITLKGKCKVYRPQFVKVPKNTFTATYTKEGTKSYYLGGKVTFGNPGVTFNATVQTPNVANAAGSIAFEQLATINYAVQGQLNGTPYSIKSSASDSLDTTDNDITYQDSAVGIAAGNTASTTDSDNPGLNPKDSDKTMQVDGAFNTYLVYRPKAEGSIWVVLGKLEWSFAFSAFYKNDDPTVMPTWVATTTSPTDTTQNPEGDDTHDLPEWSMRGQDAPWTKVTP